MFQNALCQWRSQLRWSMAENFQSGIRPLKLHRNHRKWIIYNTILYVQLQILKCIVEQMEYMEANDQPSEINLKYSSFNFSEFQKILHNLKLNNS